MKTSRRKEEAQQLVLWILVLLVIAVLIALLPARSRAALPVGRSTVAATETNRPEVGAGLIPGNVPNRAPAYVEARGRGSEGRIDRIPPRPGRGRRVWVPGRYEPAGFAKTRSLLLRLRTALEHGYCECEACRAEFREIETRSDHGLHHRGPVVAPPNPRPGRGWVWIPGHWERI